jgi:hypothetical protein
MIRMLPAIRRSRRRTTIVYNHEEFMNSQRRFSSLPRIPRVAAAILTFELTLLSLTIPTPATAAEPRVQTTSRDNAATCVSETATVLRRSPGEKTWHIVKQNQPVPAGDLLVGLPGAMVDSNNGSVRLALLADLDRLSPYPIRESAVVLHESQDVDFAVTLDRGRVEFTNRKKTGTATVRVSVRQDTWDIQLGEPGARIALELYGRWPPGVPFHKEPDPKYQPTASLLFLVVQGHVTLKHGNHEVALHAPPGPALVEWDSVTGQDPSPQYLDKLPPWAATTGKETALAKMKKETFERFRQAALAKGIDGALDEFLNSDNEYDRTLAIFAMAALDQLPRLGKALREAKHPDVWQTGVLALRHWIGRGPGQDLILYNRLIEVAKYKPVHAETVLQLLHSFGEAELASPETYQTLIDYLEHDQLAIRGLAYWHLYRLVPAGQEIGYNPLDPKEARSAAVEKWRKLVPPGKVPARATAEKNKP